MKNIEEITIRPVTEADAEKLLSIYAPYVTDTFITYEYTVPTVEEFRERIRNTLQPYPYFAAVENGRIIATDQPRKVGEFQREGQKEMFAAMPYTLQIY